jgi:hypothetical protein
MHDEIPELQPPLVEFVDLLSMYQPMKIFVLLLSQLNSMAHVLLELYTTIQALFVVTSTEVFDTVGR